MRETHFIDKDPDIYNALTELQKRNVQSMNEDQVMKFIEEFEFKWYLVDTDGYSSCMHRATRLGYNQFIHPDNFDDYAALMGRPVQVEDTSFAANSALSRAVTIASTPCAFSCSSEACSSTPLVPGHGVSTKAPVSKSNCHVG